VTKPTKARAKGAAQMRPKRHEITLAKKASLAARRGHGLHLRQAALVHSLFDKAQRSVTEERQGGYNPDHSHGAPVAATMPRWPSIELV